MKEFRRTSMQARNYFFINNIFKTVPTTKMVQIVVILTIIATATADNNINKFINVIDILLKDSGKWFLAAAGSSGVMPKFESCVQLTITDTGVKAGCILVAHDHTIQKRKILKFYGKNQSNKTEIISLGPIYQYMVKGDEKEIDDELKNEVDWDAAISSPICWHGQTRALLETKYIVSPIDATTEHFYLVAVSAASPDPEYQVAILTKTKIRKETLQKIVKTVNYKNFEKLSARSDSPGLFVKRDLPRVKIICAEGYDPTSSAEIRFQKQPKIEFKKNSPPYPEAALKTILVKHQK